MARDQDNHKKEDTYMRQSNQIEQAILNQIARLLVSEHLMNPEEQLRFMTLLKEEI